MIPLNLTLRGAIGIRDGMGRDEIKIDFTKFGQGLIALVGDNGIGKSTVMENLHPFPQLASRRGKLQNHFFLRDSSRIYSFQANGKTYVSKMLIDAKTGKIEAYLYENGVALNPDGKISTYDPLVETKFGSAELFFRSVFMAQGAFSISKATPAERRKLMMEILGFSRYEKYYEYARQQADKMEGELSGEKSKMDDLKKEIESEAKVASQISELQVQINMDDAIVKEQAAIVSDKKTTLGVLNAKMANQINVQAKIDDIVRAKTEFVTGYNKGRSESDQKKNGLIMRHHEAQAEIDRARSILDGKDQANAFMETRQVRLRDIRASIAGADTVNKQKKDLEDRRVHSISKLNTLKDEWNVRRSQLMQDRTKLSNDLDFFKVQITELPDIEQRIGELQLSRDQERALAQTRAEWQEAHDADQKATIEYQNKHAEWHNQRISQQSQVDRLEADVRAVRSQIDIMTANKRQNLAALTTRAALVDQIPPNDTLADQCVLIKDNLKAKKEAEAIERELTAIELGTDELSVKLEGLKVEAATQSAVLVIFGAGEPKPNKEISDRLMSIRYDKTRHAALLHRIAELESLDLDKKLANATAAKANLDNAQTRMAEIDAQGRAQKAEFEKAEATYKTEIDDLFQKMLAIDAIDVMALEAEAQSIEALVRETTENLVKAKTTVENKRPELERLKSDIATIEADLAAGLERYNVECARLETQKAALQGEINTGLSQKITLLGSEIFGAEQKRDEAGARISKLLQHLGGLKAQAQQIENAKADLKAIEARLATMLTRLDSWRTIQAACSKEGIPQLELDASGGYVSSVGNELLADAMDKPYQIRFETLGETEKGAAKEVFDIKVLNTETMIEKDIEMMSGGERVWIEKAIFEAISIYLTNTSDREHLTSFSDESDGALSPSQRLKYFAMMQKSFKLGRRFYTLIVTHDPAIWQQVAQRIHFEHLPKEIEYVF